MLYPIMNRSRSLIDLGGVWQFQLGDEKEPGDTWIGLLRTNRGAPGTFVRKQRTASGTAF